MSYDSLYQKGGFGYSSKLWLPRIQKFVNKHGVEGAVLDAPAGDGFWSRLLRIAMRQRQNEMETDVKCTVTPTDLSKVGCEKSGGVVWDLNEFNPDWEGKFDWVFSRGISHLHHANIDDTPFRHIGKYAKNVIVIYSTTQTNRQSASGCHFNHTRLSLNKAMRCLTAEPGTSWLSYIENGYYYFARSLND